MPELPEVEIIAQGLRPFIESQMIDYSRFYRQDLRAPIPTTKINRKIKKEKISRVWRRGKYLVLSLPSDAHILMHFGMSGKLIRSSQKSPLLPHTHWVLGSQKNYFHYVDPRRFGRIDLYENKDLENCKYIASLGNEPLITRNLGKVLFDKSRHKNKPVKNFVMDSQVVVGVGNIYAAESLFLSHIHPCKPAGKLNLKTYQLLAKHIKKVLRQAITQGGTTLQDHRQIDGSPGYFKVKLNVYGKSSEPCPRCQTPIENIKLGGRSSFYCKKCQKQ